MSDSRDFGSALVDAGLLYPTGHPRRLGRSRQYADDRRRAERPGRRLGRRRSGAAEHPVPARREPGDVRARPTTSSPSPTSWARSTSSRAATRSTPSCSGAPSRARTGPTLLEPADVVPGLGGLPPRLPDVHRARFPTAGRYFNVSSYCFRHEPSEDPARMQTFQMHEIVFVGDPDAAQQHRDAAARASAPRLLQRPRAGHGPSSRPTIRSSAASARPWPPTRRTRCSSSRARRPSAPPSTRSPSSRATATATTSAARSPSRRADGGDGPQRLRRLRRRPHHAGPAAGTTGSTVDDWPARCEEALWL